MWHVLFCTLDSCTLGRHTNKNPKFSLPQSGFQNITVPHLTQGPSRHGWTRWGLEFQKKHMLFVDAMSFPSFHRCLDQHRCHHNPCSKTPLKYCWRTLWSFAIVSVHFFPNRTPLLGFLMNASRVDALFGNAVCVRLRKGLLSQLGVFG